MPYQRAVRLLPYAAVLLPIAVAVLVIHARGWWPTNDDAFTAMAMRDTWTGHPRVMGPWSSTLGFIGVYPHHPGPALYYVTSVGALPFGFSALGILVGVGLVNALSTVATVRMGARLGGIPGAVAGAFAVLITGLYIGVGLFFRPFNPFPPLLMLLLMLFVATEFIGGRRGRWPLFALAATIAVQSHISYTYLVAGLTMILLVVGALAWHRERDAWWPMRGWLPQGAVRERLSRPMLACLVLAVLLWVPVVIELLTYHPNNFTSVLEQMRIKAAPGVPAPQVDRFEFIARGMVPGTPAVVGKTIAVLATVLLIPVATGLRVLRAPRALTMAARTGLAGIALFVVQILMVPHSAYFAEPWMVASGAPVTAFVWVVLVAYVVSLTRSLVLPRAETLRKPLTVTLAAAAACGLVACSAGLVTEATSASQGEISVGRDVRAAGTRLADAMRRWPAPDGSRRAIAVHGSGLGPVFEISPSLGMALRNDGFEVYIPPPILGHDDTAFRSTDRAPASAVRVFVVWLNEQTPESKLPGTAEAMGTVHQGENSFRIYAVPPGD